MPASAKETDLMELATDFSFADTLARVRSAIHSAGMQIFAVVDHAAAAADVDLSMPPTTVLIYGNPKGGTPVMLASPVAALDLPLRVLVREDRSGRTFIAFHPIAQTLRKAGVPEALAKGLAPGQRVLVDIVRD